ncbi:twin-arginine translocation signal domain-containing protein, partial [Azospirillum sp.]
MRNRIERRDFMKGTKRAMLGAAMLALAASAAPAQAQDAEAIVKARCA